LKKHDAKSDLGHPNRVQRETALEVTTEWITKRRAESSGAREAFANLFADADPQSA